MRTLPHSTAEDLLELTMRRYERASILLTSHCQVERIQPARPADAPLTNKSQWRTVFLIGNQTDR